MVWEPKRSILIWHPQRVIQLFSILITRCYSCMTLRWMMELALLFATEAMTPTLTPLVIRFVRIAAAWWRSPNFIVIVCCSLLLMARSGYRRIPVLRPMQPLCVLPTRPRLILLDPSYGTELRQQLTLGQRLARLICGSNTIAPHSRSAIRSTERVPLLL